ncbi:MAG: Nickel transport protein NikQ [Deltaproteobacteria bacterium ADurb.Bin510]|jgi:cobalt/nickel transport system permease protein|nr:MAG: Nickel transport protein NikQ [Deltaproteobacteria bacterium ADurb.Bin510]
MSKLEAARTTLDTAETLAGRAVRANRIDARAKLVTTLIYIVAVTSLGKYDLGLLLPFCVFPLLLMMAADLPLKILKPVLVALPFAVLIGVFNPLYDQRVLLNLGGFSLTGGWVSFAMIVFKCLLVVSAALILVATTGFDQICQALLKLGLPKVFVVQLLLLYRYIFVLIDEASRLQRGFQLRAVGQRLTLRVMGSLLGQLLLRSISRAQRIHLAMLCRGFDGEMPVNERLSFGLRDAAFVLLWSAFFVLARYFDLTGLLGSLVLKGMA